MKCRYVNRLDSHTCWTVVQCHSWAFVMHNAQLWIQHSTTANQTRSLWRSSRCLCLDSFDWITFFVNSIISKAKSFWLLALSVFVIMAGCTTHPHLLRLLLGPWVRGDTAGSPLVLSRLISQDWSEASRWPVTSVFFLWRMINFTTALLATYCGCNHVTVALAALLYSTMTGVQDRVVIECTYADAHQDTPVPYVSWCTSVLQTV